MVTPPVPGRACPLKSQLPTLADYATRSCASDSPRKQRKSSLKAQNREPTEGYLRAHSAGKLSGKDVVTLVDPAEQLRLLGLADGLNVTFQVTPDASGPGELETDRVYPAFESSGVLVEVSRVQLVDGRLTIEGKKVSCPDLIAET